MSLYVLIKTELFMEAVFSQPFLFDELNKVLG